jgi:hypothetical protein
VTLNWAARPANRLGDADLEAAMPVLVNAIIQNADRPARREAVCWSRRARTNGIGAAREALRRDPDRLRATIWIAARLFAATSLNA